MRGTGQPDSQPAQGRVWLRLVAPGTRAVPSHSERAVRIGGQRPRRHHPTALAKRVDKAPLLLTKNRAKWRVCLCGQQYRWAGPGERR